LRGSGKKKVLQQRHLRRLGWPLITGQAGRKQTGNQTRRTPPKKTQAEEGRRAFSLNSRRKIKAKKTEFQSGGFPLLSIRR
jgi:hypothetical protein